MRSPTLQNHSTPRWYFQAHPCWCHQSNTRGKQRSKPHSFWSTETKMKGSDSKTHVFHPRLRARMPGRTQWTAPLRQCFCVWILFPLPACRSFPLHSTARPATGALAHRPAAGVPTKRVAHDVRAARGRAGAPCAYSLPVLDDFCSRRFASSMIECLMPCETAARVRGRHIRECGRQRASSRKKDGARALQGSGQRGKLSSSVVVRILSL